MVGGESEREGYLEVCLNQGWGTVCDDGWSLLDSQVVCRQLGYSTSGEFCAISLYTVSAMIDSCNFQHAPFLQGQTKNISKETYIV